MERIEHSKDGEENERQSAKSDQEEEEEEEEEADGEEDDRAIDAELNSRSGRRGSNAKVANEESMNEDLFTIS